VEKYCITFIKGSVVIERGTVVIERVEGEMVRYIARKL